MGEDISVDLRDRIWQHVAKDKVVNVAINAIK